MSRGSRLVPALLLTLLAAAWPLLAKDPKADRDPNAPAAGDEAPSGTPAVADPRLKHILEEWDRRQQETRTLVASFIERKDLKLLAKPVVSHGEFYFSRPNRVRWEYSEPDHKIFVITEEMYTAYYPALKRAEAVPIKKFVGKRLFRFLGVGQKIGDLARYYDFQLAPQSDVKGTNLLLLTPRKRTVRDRVAQMKIWVDEATSLPRQLQYVESDGDTTLLTFQNMQSNVEVAESRFVVDLPKDVAVSQTFNGFSLGQQAF
jgi:outer membrane lipoprotein carrier protein